MRACARWRRWPSCTSARTPGGPSARSSRLRSSSLTRPLARARSRSHSSQAVPLARPQQDHREVADRPGLDERQRLEELVQGAEAAGADDERGRVADEHHLAGEEVTEHQADVDVRVEVLLARQLDVAADREGAGVAGAGVGRLHEAGAAAGDDRVARAAEGGGHLAHHRVVRMVGRGAGRPEHGDRAGHAATARRTPWRTRRRCRAHGRRRRRAPPGTRRRATAGAPGRRPAPRALLPA